MNLKQLLTQITQSHNLPSRVHSVRITHKPTGIQAESSWHRATIENLEAALRMLWAKLVDHKTNRPFYPFVVRTYDLTHSTVLDFNGDFVSDDPQSVLDGNLDPIIVKSYRGIDDIL